MTPTAHCLKSARKTAAGAILLGVLALGPAAHANAVVTEVGVCADYYVMAAPSGYALIQWNAGQPIAKGDTIAGDITSTGFRDALLTRGGAVRLMVEDFGLNALAANRLLASRCGVLPTGLQGLP